MIYRGEKDACENDDTTSDELHSCGAGVCRIYRVSRDGFIGFCERKTARRDTEVTITMVSDEVDEWHRHLKKKGWRSSFPLLLATFRLSWRDPHVTCARSRKMTRSVADRGVFVRVSVLFEMLFCNGGADFSVLDCGKIAL